MAIAALVLWLLTVVAGVSLLGAGQAARRAPGTREPSPAPVPAVPVPPAEAPAPSGSSASASAAIPRVRVHAPPGEHPLLEFAHPALGVLGLGAWFSYVGTGHQPIAWVSSGLLMAAIAAGLAWLARTRLGARRDTPPGHWPGDGGRSAGVSRGASDPGGIRRVVPPGQHRSFPARLAVLHGIAAGSTLVLAVLTALSASR